MAANLQNSRGLANLGKRLAAQIRSGDSAAVSHLSRRCVLLLLRQEFSVVLMSVIQLNFTFFSELVVFLSNNREMKSLSELFLAEISGSD